MYISDWIFRRRRRAAAGPHRARQRAQPLGRRGRRRPPRLSRRRIYQKRCLFSKRGEKNESKFEKSARGVCSTRKARLKTGSISLSLSLSLSLDSGFFDSRDRRARTARTGQTTPSCSSSSSSTRADGASAKAAYLGNVSLEKVSFLRQRDKPLTRLSLVFKNTLLCADVRCRAAADSRYDARYRPSPAPPLAHQGDGYYGAPAFAPGAYPDAMTQDGYQSQSTQHFSQSQFSQPFSQQFSQFSSTPHYDTARALSKTRFARQKTTPSKERERLSFYEMTLSFGKRDTSPQSGRRSLAFALYFNPKPSLASRAPVLGPKATAPQSTPRTQVDHEPRRLAVLFPGRV